MDATELLGTTDPQKWAEAFVEQFAGEIVKDEIDVDQIQGWFANAMQAKESSLIGTISEDVPDAPEARPHRFSTDALHELVFLVGGAATGPCLRNSPDLVMPTEEVTEEINRILTEKGLPSTDDPSPIITHGTRVLEPRDRVRFLGHEDHSIPPVMAEKVKKDEQGLWRYGTVRARLGDDLYNVKFDDVAIPVVQLHRDQLERVFD